MNQYAADQIALVATLTQARKRTRRWKLLASLVVVGAVAHQFSTSVRLPQPIKRGVAAVQQAVVQPAPIAKPVQPAAVKPEPKPVQPATSVQPSAEDRHREAAAAARARQRYQAAVRQMQPRPDPPPVPQRIVQPQRIVPQPAPPPARQPQRGVGLGTVLTTAAQAARIAEQIERGRFSPSRELNRAARRMEREERRRQRAERRW